MSYPSSDGDGDESVSIWNLELLVLTIQQPPKEVGAVRIDCAPFEPRWLALTTSHIHSHLFEVRIGMIGTQIEVPTFW
jgi:hypothetical protein